MTNFRIGVQLQPERSSLENIATAWHRLDELSIDSLWVPDHFFPVSPGTPDGANFECWSLLAGMGTNTTRVEIGSLVSCTAYRNPDLLADMARTTHLLSGGRLILGLGAGWCERDYIEYGFPFHPVKTRLHEFEEAVQRIRNRLAKLNPPAETMRILIGGGGERMTLRLVSEHADLWNSFGPPESFRQKNEILDGWCHEIGRDPQSIERTVFVGESEVSQIDHYLAAGAEHVIVGLRAPYDIGPVRQLLDWRESQ